MIDIFTFNEIRSTRALLKLLRRHIKTEFELTGMCGSIREMYRNEIISEEEKHRLLDYLTYNAPGIKTADQYWWTAGRKRPRRRWLRLEIKSLKN